MAYTFDDAEADERRTTQYFEMFCNRGIYHEGWTAVTRHSVPWMATEMPVRRRRVALRPRRLDQAHDLAAEQPDKLRELQRLFLIEAGSTTFCRSTTGASSASTRISPAGRSSPAARPSFFGRMGRNPRTPSCR